MGIFPAIFLGTTFLFSSVNPLYVEALRKRLKKETFNVPRLVLAFYYGWYGTPSISGHWRYYGRVDLEKKKIASQAFYPLLGPYDSHDTLAIKKHMEWAREADIDGFIVSWWGKNDFTDTSLALMLDMAKNYGVYVTAYYERLSLPHNPDSAFSDLRWLLEKYGNRSAFLKINGEPVIFIYGRAIDQLTIPEWAYVLNKLNKEVRKAIFISDGIDYWKARIFDGAHFYSKAWMMKGKSLVETKKFIENDYREDMRIMRMAHRITALSVLPGYDDIKARRHGFKIDRWEGKLYEKMWSELLKSNPDWALITSFNEWFEGTSIEPTLEYGKFYLKETRRFAQRFKSVPSIEKGASSFFSPRVHAHDWEEVKRIFKGNEVALLTDFHSIFPDWVIESGIDVSLLDYPDLLDHRIFNPLRFPIFVFSWDGEKYIQSLRDSFDVDSAILRYLRSGGFLVTTTGPYPFYYNENMSPVASAYKFGMDIQIGDLGFESPPESDTFFFLVNSSQLEHIPQKLPYPQKGDLRWRPILRKSAHDVYIPLVELYDTRGRYFGEGVGYVEHLSSEPIGGRDLYIWFRLMDQPYSEALSLSVLKFMGKRLR